MHSFTIRRTVRGAIPCNSAIFLTGRQMRLASPHKYRNVPTDGYASKREAARAQRLKLLALAGEITDLREQVRYLLIPKQLDAQGRLLERESSYVADFVYKSKAGHTIVEDCKGMRTPSYRLKRKLMLWLHKIRVTET